jgi:hypothetical protein
MFALFIRSIGIGAALRSGFGIRFGEIDLGVDALFQRFLPVLFITWCFIAYEKFVLKRSGILFFLILTFVFFIWTVILAGRGGVLSPPLIVLFAAYLYNPYDFNRKKILRLIPVIILAFLFILYGKTIFFSIPFFIDGGTASFINAWDVFESQRLGSEGFRYTSIKEFGHAYFTLDYLLKNDFSFLYFRDVYYSVIDLIPEKLTGLDLGIGESISRINTRRFWPDIDSASYPPGFIGFAYNSLGVIGIIIWSSIFGFILGKSEKLYLKYKEYNQLIEPLFAIILFILLSYFTNGDVKVFMRDSFFPSFVFVILIKMFKK